MVAIENTFKNKLFPKTKAEEFKLVALAEINGIPWEGENIENVYEYVYRLFSGKEDVIQQSYETSIDTLSFESFNFIEGRRWEYLAFINMLNKYNISSRYKNKANLNVDPLSFMINRGVELYLKNNDHSDFFRKMIYVEFFLNKGDAENTIRILENFKDELKLVREKFKPIKILSENYDKDLNLMNDVLGKLQPWGYLIKTSDDLINIFLGKINYDSLVYEFFTKYKTKISNERRKESGKEQVTLWLKKSTKLKLQNMAFNNNLSSSALIENLINNN